MAVFLDGKGVAPQCVIIVCRPEPIVIIVIFTATGNIFASVENKRSVNIKKISLDELLVVVILVQECAAVEDAALLIIIIDIFKIPVSISVRSVHDQRSTLFDYDQGSLQAVLVLIFA